ncbi:MAG: hypothetical protein N3B21_04505 [Clostridia bacterium]|nr:hypothetical protein [Clostridia bacterium]
MDNKNVKDSKIKPIEEKKNALEEALKKDNVTEMLAKAIKTAIAKDKLN